MLQTSPAQQPLHEQTHDERASIAFILRLGRALHTFGYASHRLESILAETATSLKLNGQFFSSPTSIYCGFGELDEQKTYLIRADPGSINLGRLAELDKVMTDVINHRATAVEGSARVAAISDKKPEYGWLLSTLAYCLASAASGRILGGGLREILVAGLIGLLIGLLSIPARRLGVFFDPIAAFVASFLAALMSVEFWPHSVFIATLAGLIVLMPGFMLTTALTELSTRNLISGSSRLTGALVVFIGIGFGVAMGSRISFLLTGSARSVNPLPLPPWTELVALLVMALSLAVLLRAHFRDFIWIVLVSVMSVETSRAGTVWLGSELGPFFGALTVGLASLLYSRGLKRPATITLVPGILLLVPGSIGFRSVSALLNQQVVPGIETAFRMILMAMSLVTGTLLANLLLPVRRRTGD